MGWGLHCSVSFFVGCLLQVFERVTYFIDNLVNKNHQFAFVFLSHFSLRRCNCGEQI